MEIKMDYEGIREYIKGCSENTRYYLGSDSQRIRKKKKGKKMARYMISFIAHIDSKHGGKVFGGVSYHPIIDGDLGKPFNRMMKETELLIETYEELYDVLGDKNVELHLDINSDKVHGSSCAYNAACGWVKGVTGMDAITKPNAWAASCVSDHFVKK